MAGRNGLTVVGGPEGDQWPRADRSAATFEDYRRDRCRETRNALILEHGQLAERCARRYNGRGEPHDDLVQVASIGLIKAVERFDPDRGIAFAAFATPTILGELRRYFRDLSWKVSVPRRSKEVRAELRSAVAGLEQVLGREPTSDELADRMDVDHNSLGEALRADGAYGVVSLDAIRAQHGDASAAVAGLVDERARAPHDEVLEVLEAVSRLDERDRAILYWRFFEERTQGEIGERLGLGQAQISRLLHLSLDRLRRELALVERRPDPAGSHGTRRSA
jgi:RNA polymerase sigma-B factor